MRLIAIFFIIFLSWSNAFCRSPIWEDVNPELIEKYSQFLEVAATVIDSDLIEPTRFSNASKAERDLVNDIFNRSSVSEFTEKEIFERIYQDFHYLKDFSKFEFAPDIESQKNYLKAYASFVNNLHWILSELIKDSGAKSRLNNLSEISSKSIGFSEENWRHVENPLGRSKLIQVHKIFKRYRPEIYKGVSYTTSFFALMPLMISVLNTSSITAPGADMLISSGYTVLVGTIIMVGYAFAQKTFSLMGKKALGSKELKKQKLEIKPEFDKLQRSLNDFKDFLDQINSCKTSSK